MRNRDLDGGWGNTTAYNPAVHGLADFGDEPPLVAKRSRAKGPIILAVIGALGLAGIGFALAGGGGGGSSEIAAPQIIPGQFQSTVNTDPVDPENDKPGM
jgi:hypothetical protein